MTVEQSEFDRLLADISIVDPQLAEATRQIDVGWGTNEPRDRELTELVATVLRGGIETGLFSLGTMVQGFNTFAHDFHARQADFLRSREYRAKDYAEVSRDVYSNEEFMRTVYYPALLLSYLASPNYRHILRELDRTLTSWRERSASRVLEVASGHAFLLLFALRELPRAVGVGTDIAAAAGGFADALQRSTGWAEGRFRFAVGDVLAANAEAPFASFDAAICCELLEHVPEPARFLRAIHERLIPGGRLFLSAAVRMESVDHLTLFESTAEITSLLAQQGFEVIREMSAPFLTRRPRDAARWQKELRSPLVAATFVGECRKLT